MQIVGFPMSGLKCDMYGISFTCIFNTVEGIDKPETSIVILLEILTLENLLASKIIELNFSTVSQQ